MCSAYCIHYTCPPVCNCSVWECSGSDDRLRVTRDAWSFFSAGVRGMCDGFFITCVIFVVRLRMKARIASGGCLTVQKSATWSAPQQGQQRDSAFSKLWQQHSAHAYFWHVVSSIGLLRSEEHNSHFNSSGTFSMLAGSMSGVTEFAAISLMCLIIACGEMLGGLPALKGFLGLPAFEIAVHTEHCSLCMWSTHWCICKLVGL